MPEKKAKGFGQVEEGQAFNIATPEPTNATAEEEIVLNITESDGTKLQFLKNTPFLRLTGNPLIDAYRRLNDYFVDHTKIKIREKATFFRLLSIMINAGLSLIQSLKTLSLQSKKKQKLARVLMEMAQAIEGGKSLSGAMEDYPEVFNEAQIGMIKAGEASGQLNKTLKDLAEEVEKNASITGKIKSALVYPVVILVLLVVVVFIMMVAVIPQLTKLFDQTGRELPLVTQILISVSNFSAANWPWIIVGFLALISGVTVWKKTRSGHYLWDYMMLKLPIFGPVIEKAALAKFSRSFSNLLSSGVPIIKSLEIVANAIGNEVYRKRVFLTAEDMKRGIPMAENMAESNLFPRMLVNMVEIGEQTAQLENVTLKIAQFYDEEVDNVVKALTKIMEPLIIVIIGVTVGGLVAAIMLPIIQLTNITGGFV